MGRTAMKNDRAKTEYRVVKKCPECEKEIPVACKTCPLCKSQVTPAKGIKQEEEVADSCGSSKIRRTERVRRERPDFFNSLELDNRFKKKRKRKESVLSPVLPAPVKPRLSSCSVPSGTPADPSITQDVPKKRRGRPKSMTSITSTATIIDTAEKVPEAESKTPPEEDYNINLPPEKLLQYTVILSELNRKFSTQNFKPL